MAIWILGNFKCSNVKYNLRDSEIFNISESPPPPPCRGREEERREEEKREEEREKRRKENKEKEEKRRRRNKVRVSTQLVIAIRKQAQG